MGKQRLAVGELGLWPYVGVERIERFSKVRIFHFESLRGGLGMCGGYLAWFANERNAPFFKRVAENRVWHKC
jgi:hypothetical protein